MWARAHVAQWNSLMCGYNSTAYNITVDGTITVDLLVAPLNFCQTLAGNTARHSDLPCLVADDTESLEANHFHDIICNRHF